MNIGEAARASGISPKMIRYYESIGLIRRAARSESGYRHYAAEDVHTLSFIRRARDLGFSVERIGELLALWRDRERASADVKALVLSHVAELREKIAALKAMVHTLEHLAEHCHGNERPACPIIEGLEAADGGAAIDVPQPKQAVALRTAGERSPSRRHAPRKPPPL
jgi:MerR family transcriptional regulator, copper efflux regulator